MVLLRIIGFVGSLLLTLAAYFIIVHPEFFHFNIKTAITVIFILAIFQFAVQFLFFLNIWRETGPRWNIAVFISTLTIVLIIVAFTLWIMNHLNYNMVH